MGFGLGGRAALAGAGGLPAVALYPGCANLPVPGGPALVLQGAEEAATCGEVVAGTEMALRLLPGAGHGWDAPGAIWPSPGPLLPDPAGGPRRQARADHAVTLLAAEAAADWFEALLAHAPRSAAR
jgi:dienelactone hydrolase